MFLQLIINHKILTNYFLSILSGILIFLSFPKFATPTLNSIFGFIMSVPLLIAIFNIKELNFKLFTFNSKLIFPLLTGIIGYSGIFYWVIPTFKVAGENVILGFLAMLLLSIYCTIYLVIFCFKISPSLNFFSILKSASLWVVLEILRSNILTGFPWMLVGYSQYNFLSFIQIAEFGGVYLVSFVVILVNLILANIIFFSIKNFSQYKFKIFGNIIFLIAIFFVIINYGQKRIIELNSKINNSKRKLNIILLQGNIDQYKKWDNNYRDEILNSYSELISDSITKLLTLNSQFPTLYIWPESSIPGWLLEEQQLFDWLNKLVAKTNSYHLVGTIFYGETKNEDEYYNGAILFSPEGKILQKYAKVHLVPFGEYVPMRNFLSKYIKTINELGEFTAGKEYTVFKIPDYRLQIANLKTATDNNQSTINQSKFSTLICYESIFSELTTKFVQQGAEFLANITNDAWYLKTSAPYQLFIFNIFRAIENRTFVLRAANTGISGIILPTGKVLSKTGLFTTEFLLKEISLYHEKTFYTKNINLIWLAFLGTYLLSRILTKKSKF